jgi:hypothetical protein
MPLSILKIFLMIPVEVIVMEWNLIVKQKEIRLMTKKQ